MLNDVEFREVQEVAIVDKVKIVACDGKSKYRHLLNFLHDKNEDFRIFTMRRNQFWMQKVLDVLWGARKEEYLRIHEMCDSNNINNTLSLLFQR